MANQDWYDLGDQIKRIVQDAVDSKDFRTLNQTINSTINQAAHHVGDGIKNAANSTQERQRNYREERRNARKFPYGTSAYTEYKPPKPRTAAYPKINDHKGGGLALSIVGGILAGSGGLLLFAALIIALLTDRFLSPGTIVSFAFLIPCCCAGVIMSGIGSKKYKKAKRFRLYLNALKGKTYCNLKDLESLTGKSHSFLLKELKQMIQIGWFPEGHLDKEGTCLITSEETYQEYLKSCRYQEQQAQKQRTEASAEQNMPDELREIIQEGKAFMTQIHAANDAIPGEDISNKISHMELIVQKIFQRVEQHPEVVPDLRKLMEYYLPTTIKLLSAYEELDRQPVQGENIISSKHEIEITIDTLNLAFEKLLDSLFKDTAWDISSDITVLHTMLAQEGLTKDDF